MPAVHGTKHGPNHGALHGPGDGFPAVAGEELLNPSTTFEVYSTFSGVTGTAVFDDANFTRSLSGTGATTGSLAAEDSRVGILTLSTGTTTTGRTTVGGFDSILFGAGISASFCEWIVRVPILSDGTETFSCRIGIHDASSGDATDGVYFQYVQTSSVNWFCKSSSNGVQTGTSTDSTIVVTANQWYKLRVEVDGTSESRFYIDGTLRVTHNANIPNGAGRTAGYAATILKAAGTTARLIHADYCHVRGTFATPL